MNPLDALRRGTVAAQFLRRVRASASAPIALGTLLGRDGWRAPAAARTAAEPAGRRGSRTSRRGRSA